MMKKKSSLFLIPQIFILLFFCLYLNTIQAEEFKKAPDFMLWGPHGDVLKLSDLKGKVVVINFWGTWLISKNKKYDLINNEEMLGLNELYKYYKVKKEKVEIIGICIDKMHTSTFKRFSKKVLKDIEYYILLADDKGNVEKDYGGLPVIPTTFIIDKKGNIRRKISGKQNFKKYKKEIDNLLNEK